jgi:nitrogen fixation-related uncharacterized protein
VTATDHDHPHVAYTPISVPVDYSKLRKVALGAAVVGLGGWIALSVVNAASGTGHALRTAFLTYLVGFVFWTSLPFGALSLLCIGYTTGASWALVLRRIFQASARTLPVLAVLFCPVAASVFFGADSPFWWSPDSGQLPDVKEAREEQMHRQDLYLNPVFFLARAAFVFTIFGLMIRGFMKHAPAAEDLGNEDARTKIKTIAAPGILIWALLWTVVVTDWVVSVEMSWASTMFPVIGAMNQFLTAFTFGIFLTYTLVEKNDTAISLLKDKFRIDMGSLTLGFAMVWAYASFSQFMLIWAGNLPEEIGYYKKRLNGGWEFLAYALMAFHWLFPFVILLFREVKTVPSRMKAMCLLLLAACVMDVIWWIVPAFPHEGVLHVPMALLAIAGVGGVWGVAFVKELEKKPLFPAKDTEFLATWGHH